MADGAPGGRDADPAALRAGYERLREVVLSGRPDGWRLGHGVLATRGTVAWIAALTTAAAPQPGAGRTESEPVSTTAASPPDASEIVAVLSQMAFAIAA